MSARPHPALLVPLLFLILAAPAWSRASLPQTVVVLTPAALTDAQGGSAGRAEPFTAWPLLERRDGRWGVQGPAGVLVWLEAEMAAVLPGPPSAHEPRLARLRAAPLEAALTRRLARGVIQAGDSQWLVEMAWGRPWRSFMVNRFQDEEHYVYQSSNEPQPMLLRFKGGRLTPPLPPRLETPVPPR